MDIITIYGPPGTGKTTKLLSIIEEEINKGINPYKIAFVSFTKKGTYEGRDRALQKFNLKEEELPYFKTLHSIAYKSSKINRNEIISKENYKQFSKAMGMKFTGYYTEELRNDDDKYLFLNDLNRNSPTIESPIMNSINERLYKWISINYSNFKKTIGIKDFTDLLEMYVDKGESLPVEVAVIDEAQDLTELQWKMVWKAFQNCIRIYIAGDDDQAIYEWSGAAVNYFLNIKSDHQIILNQSYRLPKRIYDYANRISSNISHRVPKKFKYAKEGGEVIYLNHFKELPIDNQNSWLMLCRNNYYLQDIKSWLQSKGLVFEFKGELSISNSIVKAINIHSKVLKGVQITPGELMHCKFYMEGNDGFKDMWYKEFTKLKPETIDYYRDLVANNTNLKKCNIKISTIHGIKGGEADNVVLLLDYTKTIEENMRINPDSELRCYYVACTRAKNKLYLIKNQSQYGYPIFK